MEYLKKYAYAIIIVFLLIVIFVQRSCSSKSDSTVSQTKEIVLPTIKDTFKSVKPKPIKPIVIHDTLKVAGKTIILKEPLDKSLATNYILAKDSIARLNLYLASIKKNKYSETFTDENISITVNAESTGTIDYIKPNYIIKERTIDAPVIVKQTVFAIYAGVELSAGKELGSLGVKGDIGIQSKKGDIYTIGYDTNNNVYVGYKLRLLNIKK